MAVYPLRLLPGMEIKSTLINFVKKEHLQAAYILTCCGSVKKVTLRYATGGDKYSERVETLNKYFEVTSLVGTVCEDGAHLHTTLGDENGSTIAGHVVGDFIVHTTAEIVLGNAQGYQFNRVFDTSTGWQELKITKTSKPIEGDI